MFGKWPRCWVGAEGQTAVFSYDIGIPSARRAHTEMNVSKAVAKVNGPPRTKEIKFGNLALTGVLCDCARTTRGATAAVRLVAPFAKNPFAAFLVLEQPSLWPLIIVLGF